MKEVNKEEPEPVTENPVKVKKERTYIALSLLELNELLDDYRKILRKESGEIKDLFISKIKELEKELRLRSIKTSN